MKILKVDKDKVQVELKAKTICPSCHGRGWYLMQNLQPREGVVPPRGKCVICEGTGRV